MSNKFFIKFVILFIFFLLFTTLGLARVWYSTRLIEKEYVLHQKINDFEKLYNENLHLQLIRSADKDYYSIKNALRKYGFKEPDQGTIVKITGDNE